MAWFDDETISNFSSPANICKIERYPLFGNSQKMKKELCQTCTQGSFFSGREQDWTIFFLDILFSLDCKILLVCGKSYPCVYVCMILRCASSLYERRCWWNSSWMKCILHITKVVGKVNLLVKKSAIIQCKIFRFCKKYQQQKVKKAIFTHTIL